MDLGDLVHDNRPAKRARRTEAAKREAELARVQDKWADLDITKFRCTTDREDNTKTFATLQPAAGITVSQWRNPESYVPCSEWVEEHVFKADLEMKKLRAHVGPFGASVHSNLPPPDTPNVAARKDVKGRTPLEKLRKQLGVMCLRRELNYYEGA